jgi:hypothetical protein
MRKIFYQECRKAGKKEHRQEELALRYCFLFLPSCLPDSFVLDGSAPLGTAAYSCPRTVFDSSIDEEEFLHSFVFVLDSSGYR